MKKGDTMKFNKERKYGGRKRRGGEHTPATRTPRFKFTAQKKMPTGMSSRTRISHLKLESSLDRDSIQPEGSGSRWDGGERLVGMNSKRKDVTTI
jgi:hypothetical protein